ncbi:MAG: tetratricopeptide repeat protein [Candidatus Nanopelagicales bacterium]
MDTAQTIQDNLPLGERLARRWLDDWRGAAVLVALLALASSITSITNGFAYDDLPIIYEGDRLHDWRTLWRVFAQSYWFGEFGRDLYRPFTLFMFGIQWAVGAGHPGVFHGFSIVLYVATTIVVLALARRFLPGRAAVVGGALWAVHPVHVEAVGNVVGQAELWVVLTVVGALCLYVDGRRAGMLTGARIAGIILLYIIGLLSKEHAIVLPGLMLLVEVVMRRGGVIGSGFPALRVRLLYWGLTLVSLLFLLIRWKVLGAVTGGGHHSLVALSAGQRVFAAVGFWPEVFRLMVWPARLYADYSPGLVTVHARPHLVHLLAGLLFLLWATLVVIGWRRRNIPILLGAVWFPLTFALLSNLFFASGVLVAERTLFLPSTALVFLVGAVAQGVRLPQRWVAALVMLGGTTLVLAAVGRSAARQRTWEDSLTVFATLVTEAPENARGHLVLGQLYMGYGAFDRAERFFVRAQALEPLHRISYADFLSKVGRCGEALTILDSALVRYDFFSVGHVARVTCLLNTKRLQEGRRRAFEGLTQGLAPEVFTRFLLVADSLLASSDSVDVRNRWVREGRPFDRTGRPYSVTVKFKQDRPFGPILNGGRPK